MTYDGFIAQLIFYEASVGHLTMSFILCQLFLSDFIYLFFFLLIFVFLFTISNIITESEG